LRAVPASGPGKRIGLHTCAMTGNVAGG
jgi:hypothetical protein